MFVALLSDQSVLRKFWLHKRKRLVAGVYIALGDFPGTVWNVLSTKSETIDKRALPAGESVMPWRILSKKREQEADEGKAEPLLEAGLPNLLISQKKMEKKMCRKGHKKPLNRRNTRISQFLPHG